MRRIGFGTAWLATLAVGGAFLAALLGWWDLAAALDLTMGVVALGGLWLVVWLPWDLYFAARRLAADQDDSVAAGIDVPARDRDAARRMAPRLLALCLALHVGAAGVIAAVTAFSGGRTGYYFAGFFLLAMLLRPIGALYGHARERLHDLSQRARHPREDVVALRARVTALEVTLSDVEARHDALRAELDGLDARTHGRIASFQGKVDQVADQLQRSVAQLTSDQELLAGIRAFVRVVKRA